MYKDLDKYICNKYYYAETKNHGTFEGYMLNYNGGNIVMISPKGIIHMPYSEAIILKPINEVGNEDLKKVVKYIKKN